MPLLQDITGCTAEACGPDPDSVRVFIIRDDWNVNPKSFSEAYDVVIEKINDEFWGAMLPADPPKPKLKTPLPSNPMYVPSTREILKAHGCYAGRP